MPEAEFVANFRLSRAAFSKSCQEIGPYIKKEDTFAKNTKNKNTFAKNTISSLLKIPSHHRER